MPASSPAIRHWAAKSGGLARDRASDDPERVEAETELATHRIAEHVRRILAKSPPLSDDQRLLIVGLLGGAE
jgi:hypothetical protein